jgi:hypothetical protein
MLEELKIELVHLALQELVNKNHHQIQEFPQAQGCMVTTEFHQTLDQQVESQILEGQPIFKESPKV